MSTIKEKFSCLEGLVGITASDCECLGEILPEYQESSQSIYVDGLLNPLIELKYNNCNQTTSNAWSGIADKLTDAINEVGNEISLRLTERYDKYHNAFDLTFGRNVFNTVDYSISEPKVIFRTKKIEGFSFLVHRIGLLVNTSRTIPITIKKKNEDGVEETVRTINVATESMTPNIFVIKTEGKFDPVVLECDGSTYTFSYELDSFNCLNNLIFNTCSKCNDDLVPFMRFMDCNIRETHSNKANGFLIDIKGYCDIEKLICLILSESPELSFLLANTIRYKTALLCLRQAKTSSSIFNLITRNNIDETILEFEKEYYASINRFLKSDLPTINKSCFCKSSKSIIAVR